MSHSPGGRESPSSTASSTTASGSGSVIGSVGSGSNGCRNSGASFDSGRATSTTFQGVRYSGGGLSSESSLGSFRNSYHSSSSSLGSIPSEEIRNFDVAAMISQGVPDHEILNAWLTGIHLECYYQNFIQAGYDMHTISRMTPEDLNAIGVTKPHHRKRIKSEISQLNISEGLPDYIPEAVDEWLRLLKLDEYLMRLIDQGYHNVRQVTNITWEDLDDIGILKLGHQKKFMLAIKRVQDILSGKRLPMTSHVPNAYLTTLENFHMPPQQQHVMRNHNITTSTTTTTTMPYSNQQNVPHIIPQQSIISQENSQYHSLPFNDPRHHIQRSLQYSMQSFSAHSHPTVGGAGISHQIQIHQPPQETARNAPSSSGQNISASHHQTVTGDPGAQAVYHPEVISIRVKNGHCKNSMDSPPEEEPIYGTSSFHPSTAGAMSHVAQPMQQILKGNYFKSYEDGETASANGHSNSSSGINLSMTKQAMSNTWTLPRLQKHKPISKVMGGGTNSNCDSSVTYPINPGQFIPNQLNAPAGPPPPPQSISTFAGKSVDFGGMKNGPPPPPRRSSCSSLGNSQQFEDDNLPLPPPPPTEPDNASVTTLGNSSTLSASQNALSKPSTAYSNTSSSELAKMYGMSASYYSGQRITNMSSNNGYHNGNSITTTGRNKISNGGIGYATPNSGFVNRSSTLPKSRDASPSPANSDLSDPDLPSINGFLSKGVRRNGSDASFKSNSSTESESIPFANDNAGTIKQQKPANRTSQQPGGIGDSIIGSSNQRGGEAGDVLSDIGSMLADLTDQLDAILEQERTSKH